MSGNFFMYSMISSLSLQDNQVPVQQNYQAGDPLSGNFYTYDMIRCLYRVTKSQYSRTTKAATSPCPVTSTCMISSLSLQGNQVPVQQNYQAGDVPLIMSGNFYTYDMIPCLYRITKSQYSRTTKLATSPLSGNFYMYDFFLVSTG